MKAFLLTAATCLAFAGSVFAQNLPPDYQWEVGVNGGTSAFTRPLGPAVNYQGRRTDLAADYSLRLDYYFNPHWMINLDLGNTKWTSHGNWQFSDLNGQQLQSREITFLVANHAINESIGMNYVIPFYSRYNTFNRANLYFGAQFGLMTTVNDGSLHYSNYNHQPDSTFNYLSRYDYGYGIGLNYGLQAGFTYYILPRLGVNVDVAVRYTDVHTHDDHYASENNHYHLLYFPETVGVRWRF